MHPRSAPPPRHAPEPPVVTSRTLVVPIDTSGFETTVELASNFIVFARIEKAFQMYGSEDNLAHALTAARNINHRRPDLRVVRHEVLDVGDQPSRATTARVLIVVQLEVKLAVRALAGKSHRRPRQVRANLNAQ